jgi:hypothetical protein
MHSQMSVAWRMGCQRRQCGSLPQPRTGLMVEKWVTHPEAPCPCWRPHARGGCAMRRRRTGIMCCRTSARQRAPRYIPSTAFMAFMCKHTGPWQFVRVVPRHVFTCTCHIRTWHEALSCSVWSDAHVDMFRLGLIYLSIYMMVVEMHTWSRTGSV